MTTVIICPRCTASLFSVAVTRDSRFDNLPPQTHDLLATCGTCAYQMCFAVTLADFPQEVSRG